MRNKRGTRSSDMSNRPWWKRTKVTWEWSANIWERMAQGDTNTQVGLWLDEQDHHLDRDTLAQVRLELKDLPEDLVSGLPRQVQRLRWELRGEPVRTAEPISILDQLRLVKRWREHWRDLRRPLQELRGIGVFPPGAREIQSWLLGPDPSNWPVPGGQVQLDQQGKLGVKLWLTDRPEGELLQQHLPEESLWETIEKLRLAMEADLTARRNWYLWTLAYVKNQLKLPGSLEEPWNCGADPQLLITYGNTLYEQVFRQVADLRYEAFDADQFTRDEAGRFCYHGTPIMLNCSATQEAKAAELLIRGQQELVQRVEAQSAGAAYRRVENQTNKLKESLDEILALTDPPRNSACDQCRSWAEALNASQQLTVS